MRPTGYEHEGHHGFCTICGSVWPCARAERLARAGHGAHPTAVPVPRPPDRRPRAPHARLDGNRVIMPISDTAASGPGRGNSARR